ncbi:MAG: CCA tRNA nucleotidyltransferase [Reyranellaceae bacterium]
MQALAAAGGVSRYVGGCVRNALLDRAVDDVDIATTLEPAQTMKALENAGIKAIATGLAHGTVTAVAKGRHFEVTTLRRDAEAFGRKARVEYTDDWLEDAARRDFTFNALYCDADGTLYDPFDGRADLVAGRVRFVGQASARIAEDYLRAFRFFRFLAWYGRPPVDEEAMEAIAQAAPRLNGLSGERVQKEMLRLLAAADPAPALALMHEAGVFVHWLPEFDGTGLLQGLLRIEAANGIEPESLRRLAALLEDEADAAAVAERWKTSRAARERLEAALREEPQIVDIGAAAMRALIYRCGNRSTLDRLMLHAARARIGVSHPALVAALDLARHWQAPTLPIGGADVIESGLATGVAVGRLLDAVEEWWIAGDFAADREACLAQLGKAAAGDA